MITEAQRKIRATGIGASEMAAVMGLSRYMTPMDVYARKVHPDKYHFEETEQQKIGNALESVVLDLFESRTGCKLARSPRTFFHQLTNAMLMAHLDAYVELGGGNEEIADRSVVEAKSSGMYAPNEWGEAGTDQVPTEYLIQVMHQMLVAYEGSLVVRVGYLAVLIGGSDFRIYKIPYDQEIGDLIIDHANEFWKRVVLRIPPDPITIADANLRYERSNGKTIEATDEIKGAVGAALTMQNAVNANTKHLEAHKLDIMKFMGDHDSLMIDGKPVATWKSAKWGKIFNEKLFAVEHPGMHHSYLIPTEGSRRFLLKKPKG